METGQLRKNAIGYAGLVCVVIATNGPFTSLVGAVPTMIAVGNGVGVPGTFIVAGLLYLLFSVGFTAMSRHVKNAGAFYAYIGNGLGRPTGVGGAFLAIVAYNALAIALYAMIGFFLSQMLEAHFGLVMPWWASALVSAGIVQYAGLKNIEFSGKFLAILMVAEIAVIIGFDLVVMVAKGGPVNMSVQSFDPSMVLTSAFGATMVFIVSAFTGFETAAIYAEEARDAERTVPKATYTAVILITVLFAVSSWCVVEAHGAANVVNAAQTDPGNLWFSVADKLGARWLSEAMAVLMITSLLAALISFHNTIARYMFALARERMLWKKFAAVHKTQQTPYVASITQTLITVVSLVLFGVSGHDALMTVMPVTAFISSVGIVAVQALTAMAIVAYFWRDHRGVGLWGRLVAPALSAAGLSACLGLMIANQDMLTGGIDSPFVNAIPGIMFAIGVIGVVRALWCKAKNPSSYASVGTPV